ncbi:hypothetical protein [Kitasatospora sp. McL0602]|uniref:hypothetical protein n=1 Tax=Kitasatospora sp. McL0602 TaxID=3439530 RepID=UPI003F894BC1
MSDPYGDDRLALHSPVRDAPETDTATVAQLIQDNARDQADADLLHDIILGPLTSPKTRDEVHNASGYRAGCRCELCTAANTADQRDRINGRTRKHGANR